MRAKRKQVFAGKTEIKVAVNVNPGSASPAQKAAWHRFWAKLITEVKNNQRDDGIPRKG